MRDALIRAFGFSFRFQQLQHAFLFFQLIAKNKFAPGAVFLAPGAFSCCYSFSTAMATSFWLRFRNAVISSASSGWALMRAKS